MPEKRDLKLVESPILGHLIAICLLVFSCATNKAPVEKPLHSVVLKFQKHEPFCGGAYPNPEQLRGWVSPITNQQYAIFKAENDSVKHSQKAKPLGVYKTDSLGLIHGAFSTGYYYAVHVDKTMSFENFYKKHEIQSDQYRQSGGRPCFKEWYATPEMRFQVVSRGLNKFEVTLQSYCFIGLMRCISWVGPMPP